MVGFPRWPGYQLTPDFGAVAHGGEAQGLHLHVGDAAVRELP